MVILSSPSGAGKTTLVNLLSKQDNFEISISHTTRQPRPNETPNKDYYFVNDEEFKRVLDDKNINHQSTLSEIKKVAKVENNSTTDNKIALLGIGSLKVDKTKVEKNDFSKFQKDIKKFMNNYKFLTIEFANGFKETIDALVDTRENKDRNSNSISA